MVAAFLTQTLALDDATVKFGKKIFSFLHLYQYILSIRFIQPPSPEYTEIWDTAGQERYRSLAPMYYRGAAAAVVVYDITNPDSFAGAKSWVKELQRRGDQNVVIAMVSTLCIQTVFIQSSAFILIIPLVKLFIRPATKQT